MEQPKIVSSAEIPSSTQQKIPYGIETPIPFQPTRSKIIINGIKTPSPIQPIKTEIKTNSIETPILTQSIEVGGAETSYFSQLNKLYDPNHTSSEIMCPDKNASDDKNCDVNNLV